MIYPTSGALFAPFLRDEEVRRAACRAFNMYTADQFQGLGDRLAPAAVVPMYSPQEAVEEFEFAVKTLGIQGGDAWQSPAAARSRRSRKPTPEASRYAMWHDALGLDSDYDYDPVWAKCLELGVSPTFHSASSGIGLRTSISNFVYNHIGHLARRERQCVKPYLLAGLRGGSRNCDLAFSKVELVGHAVCIAISLAIGRSVILRHWKK